MSLSPPSRRGPPRAQRVAAALLAISATTACGASLNAIYEGDVRFEHCMALDYGRDVKPTLRAGCWREWVRFYTFGQTRDRVEYAEARIRQLDRTSDFAEDLDDASTAAATEPTSALAPPPRVITADAGAGEPPATAPALDAGPAELSPDAGLRAAPDVACASDCDVAMTKCQAKCAGVTCREDCKARRGECVQGCR